MSERELNLLCEAIANDEVHLATEVRAFSIKLIYAKLTISSLIVKGNCGCYWHALVRAL